MLVHGQSVDWRRPGPFTKEERDEIVKWYSDLHGEDNLDLSSFLTFWLKHNEQAFKKYRRLLESSFVSGAPTESVSFLVFLHSYVIAGYEAGVLYEVIGCHKLGVSRQQMLDCIELAFLHAGPRGMNGIAAGVDAYLDKWTDDVAIEGPVWPTHWDVDPDAFKSGLDFSKPGMTDAEVDSLKRWYVTNQGEVPSYVTMLARWNPEALKAYRARYEGAVTSLPKQLVPLMMFHSAALSRAEGAMRRYAFQARHYGAKRSELVELITSLLMYTGDILTEYVADAVSEVLDGWK